MGEVRGGVTIHPSRLSWQRGQRPIQMGPARLRHQRSEQEQLLVRGPIQECRRVARQWVEVEPRTVYEDRLLRTLEHGQREVVEEHEEPACTRQRVG